MDDSRRQVGASAQSKRRPPAPLWYIEWLTFGRWFTWWNVSVHFSSNPIGWCYFQLFPHHFQTHTNSMSPIPLPNVCSGPIVATQFPVGLEYPPRYFSFFFSQRIVPGSHNTAIANSPAVNGHEYYFNSTWVSSVTRL